MKIIMRILFILLLTSLTGCAQEEFLESVQPRVTVSKVYGDGSSYCAFTSMVKRGDSYYMAFREGETHVADNDYGIIRILKSTDGSTWSTMQILSVNNIDLRDPNLSVMPDNRLLLLCGARGLSDNSIYVTRTYKAIETKEDRFETPEIVNLPNEIQWETCSWVWRLTWNKDIGYGVCYGNESPVLLKTKDGLNYEKVCNLDIPGDPSECRIRFKNDGTAIMLVRRDQGSTSIRGVLGFSKVPYLNWEWNELNVSIAGEEFLIDEDRIIVATRMTQNIGSWTAIWFGDDRGSFNWCYTLPYGGTSFRGDTGYAGMINERDEYWVSYYAKDEGEKPSVFLVKIPKVLVAF